tara:strand:+ start:153 stop:917 length:765 start_codon:yes stop_codon:yes gene_type:complete
MHHVFITPLAWDLSEYHPQERLLQSSFEEGPYSSYEDRIFGIVNYWICHTSKFYTKQKSKDTFEVFLLYSKRFRPILDMFYFPEWVKLVECSPEQVFSDSCSFLLDEKFREKYEGCPVSISRTDADDIFSNNIFNIISSHKEQSSLPYFLIIYKTFRQYLRWSEEWTEKVTTPDNWSSGNVSLVLNPYSESLKDNENEFIKNLDLLANHSELPSRCDYREESKCSFVQTLGSNLANTKWTEIVDENFESLNFTL